jgi:hypothetical protein
MKKALLVSLLVLVTVLSFGQIYRGEGNGKNGSFPISLHFVDYINYRYLLYIENVSIFLDEENIVQLRAVLEKFISWETVAATEQLSLTKTIDSIRFGEFHYNHTFFKEPLTFYFVFTGPLRSAGTVVQSDTEIPEQFVYTLFIDTTFDTIGSFRLSRETVEQFLEALSLEHLEETLEAYEQQKALEELFN